MIVLVELLDLSLIPKLNIFLRESLTTKEFQVVTYVKISKATLPKASLFVYYVQQVPALKGRRIGGI